MRKLFCTAMVALYCCAPLMAQTETKQKSAASVNGVAISERDVSRLLLRVPPIHHKEARSEILGSLIEQALLDQYLNAQKIVVEAKEVDARLATMKEAIAKQKQKFEDVLKSMMLTEPELKEHIASEIRWEKFAAKYTTEAVTKDFFAKNKDIFNGSMVRARHILVAIEDEDKEKIEKGKTQLTALRQQILAEVGNQMAKVPADTDKATKAQTYAGLLEKTFGEYAKKHSSCPSKKQGGDVSWFHRTGTMVEPFAAAAFALQPTQVSGIVQSPFGLHLILVTQRRPGKDVTYDKMKDVVKSVYRDRMRRSIIDQLRNSAKIVIYDTAK